MDTASREEIVGLNEEVDWHSYLIDVVGDNHFFVLARLAVRAAVDVVRPGYSEAPIHNCCCIWRHCYCC